MEKVLLGMSGGKDSTWACRVLQSKGYEVEGLLLVLHENAPVDEAEQAAKRLGIKLHVTDLSQSFNREVKDHFCREYLEGRTPNPCVECNRRIKFEALINEADRLGIEKISTGHYVRVGQKGERYTLGIASDTKKDQSYFLWQLTQNMLSRFVSPLEDVTKDEVVERVIGEGLLEKVKESQEICFIPDDDHIGYIKAHLSPEEADRAFSEGVFVDRQGKVLGKSRGYGCYTVGQRKGLGIALGRPAFVLELDARTNSVVLGFEEDNACREFTADSLNFVSVEEFEGEKSFFVRPRYRSPLIECAVSLSNGLAKVRTAYPIKLVSPGQSAVFYDADGTLAFGGKITAKMP